VVQQENEQESDMNRYEFSILRVATGIAAATMTALTLGLSVVVPVHLASAPHEAPALAASKVAQPAAIEVAIIPSRIDVLAQRTQKTAYEPARHNMPKRNQAI
jgi:hypothetical protein